MVRDLTNIFYIAIIRKHCQHQIMINSCDIQRHHGDEYSSVEIALAKATGMQTNEIRDIRDVGDDEAWELLKFDILEPVQQNRHKLRWFDEGRRYMAFRCYSNSVAVKVLHKTDEKTPGGKSLPVPTTVRTQAEVFESHRAQHKIVVDGMGRFVPDTVFSEGALPHFTQVSSPRWETVNPEHTYFVVQDYLHNAVPVLDALKDSRAEAKTFLDDLCEFLGKYDKMRFEQGYIPELLYIGGKNMVVDADGKVWLPDTNNIIPTRGRKGKIDTTYREIYKVTCEQVPDIFMRRLEEVITQVEKGNVEVNPQG